MSIDGGDSLMSKIKHVVWPIENRELKKFLPMAAMMFFVLFNYSLLRTVKDGLIVPNIGAEALGFLKMYFVFPSAVIAMILYARLCNTMSSERVFYTIVGFFGGYLALFSFVLYPNADSLHPSHEYIEQLALELPYVKWFIRIIGKWAFATFYIVAELWGSLILSLLFWQFANHITKSEEAKRFYAMFGLIGNFGPIAGSYIVAPYKNSPEVIVLPIAVAAFIIMYIYYWMNRNVLTDARYYDPNAKASKKSKTKLSMGESFKLIFSSKYLGLIAMLVLCYGLSINLVEGVWKDRAKALYPNSGDYMVWYSTFTRWSAIVTIVFMVIGNNIIRRVSWYTAAILTPLMMLVTGLIFFCMISFDHIINDYVVGIFLASPLLIAVTVGSIQNILTKSAKYSLFDPTKEMAYIPIDHELKTKGKAAVDVVGGRLGKSGGAAIQSAIFTILPSAVYADVIPFFGVVFFVTVILWIVSVKSLSKEYQSEMESHSM